MARSTRALAAHRRPDGLLCAAQLQRRVGDSNLHRSPRHRLSGARNRAGQPGRQRAGEAREQSRGGGGGGPAWGAGFGSCPSERRRRRRAGMGRRVWVVSKCAAPARGRRANRPWSRCQRRYARDRRAGRAPCALRPGWKRAT
eukprot:7381812-Prymnesium_polylepis.2